MYIPGFFVKTCPILLNSNKILTLYYVTSARLLKSFVKLSYQCLRHPYIPNITLILKKFKNAMDRYKKAR